MKYSCYLLLALAITGCKNKFTDITGTVKGLSSGTMIIKDDANNTLFTENIEDGKFHFKKIIDSPGYYHMRLVDDGARDSRRQGYDVYLEAGTYTLDALPEAAHQYPVITSTSNKQTELSDYYAIANTKTEQFSAAIEKYNNKVNSGNQLSKDESLEASSDLTTLLARRDSAMGVALQEYVAKYPQNHVEAHIMYQLAYAANPDIYSPAYQKFNADEKKTQEGAEEGDKLNDLAKLMVGATAPPLNGKTLDGKPFNPKSLNKKVILIEFWRSDDKVSFANHNILLHGLLSPLYNKNLGMVSVSLDIEEGVWKNMVNGQKLPWPQVCDFKGPNSPNISNWQISVIPTYYLVSGDWKIIKRDISLADVPDVMNKYLKTNQ